MPSLFCMRCKSLTPPGAERCRQCGAPIGDVEAKQHCLTERTFELKEEGKKILPRNKLAAPFFPYEPRESQMDIVSDITNALNDSKHIVIESGTGTGKTICALAGTLHHAKMNGKKVIYLTRTLSQSDQVMKELRNINEVRETSGIAISGRKHSCPLLSTMKGYEDIMPNVLSRLCEEKKAKSLAGGTGGCRFFSNVKRMLPKIEEFCRKEFPRSEELDAYCESEQVCPYEARKSLLQGVDVVVAPYVHILSEDIRANLLAHMRCDDNVVLIVDEAHNLISAAREQGSFSIHVKDLDKAMKEAAELQDPVLYGTLRSGELIGFLRALIKGAANEKIAFGKKEALIEHDRIESKIMKKFRLSANELASAVDQMIDVGESRTEYLLDRGTHEVSELFSLGVSLKAWISSEEGMFIKIVKADEGGESLSASCIDPSEITMFIRSLKGAVHMSGTLQPLEQYARTMGLPDTSVMKIYPTPFPPENRSVVYVNGVTTKFTDLNDQMYRKLATHIVTLCNGVPKNTLVFFPSYSVMSKMRQLIETEIEKTAYWEESGRLKNTKASLDRFRRGRNGVFFTVMGGSIAEGIDFPGDELAFAVIVGIPYPPPTVETDAMSEMFDKRYGPGMGWLYVSEAPALRKIKQAIGRLIRNETDRGMAVILDSRTSKYEKQFVAKLSSDPVGDAKKFFRGS